MSDTAIKVENLGKRYRLHHEKRESYTALRDVIARQAKRLLRPSAGNSQATSSDEDFWALKDVSFEVKQGEVVGIIGRNGAGKSTLLKVLSRITEPTTGRITLEGRVASLLEVGTGFHPELTGRENIYLNGAILGMTKVEISAKFDEIVAFAEVERFLDTPVKRYSSGMYVRLAFAVAAHLEPEILVVDEVLAVGDAAFQRKCLGKMGEVCGSGRTVLFVSHNMQSVQQLCQRAVWLEKGCIKGVGQSDEIVNQYIAAEKRTESLVELNAEIAKIPSDPAFILKEVDVLQDGVSAIELVSGRPVEVRFNYEVLEDVCGLHVFFQLCDMDGSLIFESLHNGDAAEQMPLVTRGTYTSVAVIPADFLAGRSYELHLGASIASVRYVIPKHLNVALHVHSTGLVNRAYSGYSSPGRLAPLIPWHTEKL